ncbi:unnamed protein product [Moneuplotes crassus]|uniref:Uncharacterized protein n=1 Tax=Euplotes crassus TaxID=5936 RepID=A0AAD2D1F9_EUPCR|nr:unnamed protein product [Moneuplotes crassus]
MEPTIKSTKNNNSPSQIPPSLSFKPERELNSGLSPQDRQDLSALCKEHRIINAYCAAVIKEMVKNMQKNVSEIYKTLKKVHINVATSELLELRPPCVKESGDKYFGHWSKLSDREEGQGITITTEGTVYQGFWKNGFPDGQGTFIYTDGVIYQGDVKKGLRQGKGVMVYPDGDRYEGNWEDNKRNGYGITTCATGDRYEGEYVNNTKEGTGTLSRKDGRYYHGEWKQGKYSGYGCTLKKKGNEYFGCFEKEKFTGLGTFIKPDGSMFEGEWKNGKPKHGRYTDSLGREYNFTDCHKSRAVIRNLLK